MTTITTYSTLQDAIAEYLARDDLTARIPSFIQLAEAKFNRELFVRQMEQRSTATIDITTTEPEFISLPSDFQSMRRIRLSSVTGKPHLEYLTGALMDEFRFGSGNVTGQPKYFSILGTEFELAPTPDANYTLEMVYRKNVTALSSTDTSNWLLALAPDLYLYGSLLEATPYMKEDPRIQTWGTGLAQGLEAINKLGLTSTFNAGPLVVRMTGVTP